MEENLNELKGRILLQEILIENLFDKFDYNLSMENQEGVTILYGLNGIGKTTILKIVDLFYRIEFKEIFNFPFKKFGFKFHWFQESNKIYTFIVLFSNLDEKSILFSIKGEDLEFTYNPPNISQCEVMFSVLRDKLHSDGELNKIFNFDFLDYDKEISAQLMIVSALSGLYCHYIESLRNSISKFEIFEEYYLTKKHDYEELTLKMPQLIDFMEQKFDFKPKLSIDVLYGLMNFFFEKKLELISNHLKEIISTDSEDVKLFINTINEYLDFKRVIVIEDKGIVIFLEDQKELPLSKLSSGEKNLIVIFYEIIFKTSNYSLVMIDEPEISLNINWHYDFIDTLRNIRKEKKIHYLIATHSPQIVNDYTNNCVDAEYKEKLIK